MNCAKHYDLAAVAACQSCGAGMCSDCVNESEYRIDNKPLCRDCNYALINNMIAEDKRSRIWTAIKLALGAICVLVACVALANGAKIENVIIIAALGAMPTAFKIMFHSTPVKNQSNDIMDSFMSMVIVGLLKFVVAVLIAAVAAPILVIVNLVKLLRCNARIKTNMAYLANM